MPIRNGEPASLYKPGKPLYVQKATNECEIFTLSVRRPICLVPGVCRSGRQGCQEMSEKTARESTRGSKGRLPMLGGSAIQAYPTTLDRDVTAGGQVLQYAANHPAGGAYAARDVLLRQRLVDNQLAVALLGELEQ